MLGPVEKLLKKLLSNAINRTIVTAAKFVDGQILLQTVSRSNDNNEDIELLCQFGFRSLPPVPEDGDSDHARGIRLLTGGKKSNGSVIVVDSKNHGLIELLPGESLFYNKDSVLMHAKGDDLLLSLDGKFEIKIGAMTFTMDSTGLKLDNGDFVQTSGDMETDGEMTADGIPLSTHKHGGVQSGGSQTSGPVP